MSSSTELSGIAGGVSRESAAPRLLSRWVQALSVRGFEWNVVALPIQSLPAELEGFRIVQISDTHLRAGWDSGLDQVLARVHSAVPDLLLLTGDFAEEHNDASRAMAQVQRLVSGLRARLGVLAILGNHDGNLIAPHLRRWGVTLLNGSRMCWENGEAGIEVIGCPGPDRVDLDERFLRRMPPKRAGRVRIVMAHAPSNVLRLAALQPDVVFAGHTHGGQMCLPGGFPLVRHDTLPRRFAKGVHRLAGTWLVANRGLGYSALPVRTFCPAEVVEVRLRRADPI